MPEPIVKVEQGKLKGQVKKSPSGKEFYSFKGIPYASPPVGDLRFAPPSPPKHWGGIRDATKDVNICPQLSIETNDCIGNEDCLYLNVYTPQLPETDTTLLPVMFYIHGGGFLYGNGTDDEIETVPDFLVEKNVVVVTINYRLGILGFLSLNCKEATGNMGLKDQVQALKWAQKNIKEFNGDPKNITLFGTSAGGASVEYQLLSPMSNGLFHKAIIQCGSTLSPWAQSRHSKVKQLTYNIATMSGRNISDDKELLKYLKNLEVKKLVKLSMTALATDESRAGLHFGFVPVVETPGDWEPFISRDTYDMLKDGDFKKVPLMTSTADREGLIMLGFGNGKLERVVKENNFVHALPFKLTAAQESEIESRLRNIYLKPQNKFKEPDSFAIDYFTDMDFLGAIYTATSFIVKNSSEPVYFYEFSYDGNLNHVKKLGGLDHAGACHGDELGYFLKNRKDLVPTKTDLTVRERMTTLLTNFAKYGNPTPEPDSLLTTKWEPATVDKIRCLEISDTLAMKDEIYPDRLNFFKELYENFPRFNVS